MTTTEAAKRLMCALSADQWSSYKPRNKGKIVAVYTFYEHSMGFEVIFPDKEISEIEFLQIAGKAMLLLASVREHAPS